MTDPLLSAQRCEAQDQRGVEAAACRTQVELAAFLEVAQSSVSDAKRRGRIPAERLMTLFEKKRITPEWVLYGQNLTGEYLE